MFLIFPCTDLCILSRILRRSMRITFLLSDFNDLRLKMRCISFNLMRKNGCRQQSFSTLWRGLMTSPISPKQWHEFWLTIYTSILAHHFLEKCNKRRYLYNYMKLFSQSDKLHLPLNLYGSFFLNVSYSPIHILN
jgi:hypothetical protein